MELVSLAEANIRKQKEFFSQRNDFTHLHILFLYILVMHPPFPLKRAKIKLKTKNKSQSKRYQVTCLA